MGVRGRFERFLLRQLSYKCILYSEMFVAETLMYSRYTDDIIEFAFFVVFYCIVSIRVNIRLLVN